MDKPDEPQPGEGLVGPDSLSQETFVQRNAAHLAATFYLGNDAHLSIALRTAI